MNMRVRRRASGKRRRVVRWLVRGLGLLVLVLVLPSLHACATSAPPPAVILPGPPPASASPSVPLYVVDWGYHSAIFVPQPAGWELGPPGEEAAPFLEYAWGDRRFYMESNFWPHSVFATLFLPTRTVTYVEAWQRPPSLDDEPRALYTRGITVEQWAALLQELERWIPRDNAGRRPPAFPAVQGYRGRFYPGYGTYFWWMDCNRWTVERLQATGLAGSGRGVVFSGQIGPRLLGFTKVGR